MISIIVLAYNSLEDTTKPCVESIFRNSNNILFELIVVDNGSTDLTPEYLKKINTQYENVKILINPYNKGYAEGNNDGIRLATGEIIILLNSDTLVTQNWLSKLTNRFSEDSDIGLIGPITNSAGNEQRVEIDKLNEFNFETKSQEYTSNQMYKYSPTERLGFFCVAIQSKVIKQVGLLDPAFGLGMFEDDDYCVRVMEAGFKLQVVEDCFIYHKGGVGFNKLVDAEYQNLFERNRKIFVKKHGIEWTLGQISLTFWERFNSDLRAFAEKQRTVSPEIERILVRLDNFHHTLFQAAMTEVKLRDTSSKLPAPIKRSIWRSRYNNLKRNFIFGSWNERKNYFSYIFRQIDKKIFNRHLLKIDPAIHELANIISSESHKGTIIFPATVDFDYMKQRPQHLAETFNSLGYVVVYGTLCHRQDKIEVVNEVRPNLFVLHEHFFQQLATVIGPERVTYFCMWPNNAAHIDYLPFNRLIYDYMDDLSLLEINDDDAAHAHNRALLAADIVTTSAQYLLNTLPEDFQSKAFLVPNAVSKKHIERCSSFYETPRVLAEAQYTHCIGYYGAIDEWMDFELLEFISATFAHCQIVMIGPVNKKVKTNVSRLLTKTNNISLFPTMPSDDLTPYLQHFDVCIVPFIKNSITDAISPVKVYEFFAAGKNVICTDLEECSGIDQIKIGKTHEEFCKLLNKVLQNPTSAAQSLIETAKNNTWEHRAKQIEMALLQKP